MTTTREKILKTSLGLFNKKGIDQVSIRDITSKLKISVGNLNYYFPSKNDIVHALCLECIGKVDEAVQEFFIHPTYTVFETIYKQTDLIFSIQLQYSFIFKNRYAEILTSLPTLQDHYRKILKVRFDEWMKLHTLLVRQGLANSQLIAESYPLSYMLNTLALFWHQEASIYFPEFTDKQKKAHGLSVMFQAYKPYLTKKGLDQLMPLLKKLAHY